MARRFLISALFLAACGSSSSARVTPPADTSDAGADVDPQAEATDSAQYGDSASKLTASKGITELFVSEDPTIDPAKTAGDNADSVAAQVKASVSACPMATVAHTTGAVSLTVDFGAGCTIGSLGTVSGSVAVQVTKGAGVGVGFTFTNVVAGGFSISGTATESTTDGTAYASDADLTVDGHHLTFKGTAKLDADAKGVTLDGAGTAAPMGTATAYTLAGVHHVFGGCYADAGKITLTKQTTTKLGKAVTVAETIAFDASTPSTGMVNITVSGATKPTTLPKYATCPHG